MRPDVDADDAGHQQVHAGEEGDEHDGRGPAGDERDAEQRHGDRIGPVADRACRHEGAEP